MPDLGEAFTISSGFLYQEHSCSYYEKQDEMKEKAKKLLRDTDLSIDEISVAYISFCIVWENIRIFFGKRWKNNSGH
ncbi:MAG: hypothetical protein IJ390_03690 [Lachnospiraceae bacterium]|nr:hypothetical protein [Lachnospiraceae bacterium]